MRSDVVAQLRSDELRRVLAQRKLLLVLDLDHTLLNSARAQDVRARWGAPHTLLLTAPSQVDAASLEALHAATHTEMQRPGGPELYELKFMRMWTKLRPGARALLAAASPLCEVLVYTMGDRAYAAEMARLLDPQGLLLRAGRVISAGDSTKSGVKDLDVVLGDARAVLVLDDTRGVWPRHSENVIVPDRYHYFPSSASAHGGAAAASLLAQGRDESEAEGTLAALSRLIARVHCAFFAGADAERLGDVRHHLRCQRVQVLAGCVLVFSGLIPQGSNAEKHPLWRLAVELGATASTDQRADGTHLVTPAMGTEKGRWAAREGLLCVKPAWLHACSARWEHTAEEPYLPG